ncbi:cardiomyopathy-associated protein 5 [Denticeps clupeoides]|uniref:cardiomyopathy-associated protein 5 n=1 Tax=Denticeps clupeoides TaxID=299321 RepID=UPI0010A3280A|nr:cardiomyopathy-associated protein 5-like [Denticeps clupeoides]
MDTLVETGDTDLPLTSVGNKAVEEGGDEVEELRNSLKEVLHDQAVRPKLQCLMMDPSFSMVTVQGEDSGVVWETASSRCSTPWASEFNTNTSEVCHSLTIAERSATPRSGMAGNIIFIMDDTTIVRRKRKKKSEEAAERQRKAAAAIEESLVLADRPAMVEVSLPNVKSEGEGEEEATTLQEENKEQSLFSLVSEGSEILNIVVPPKIATVDEEVSKELEDNLVYLEESPVLKMNNESLETLTITESREGQVNRPITIQPYSPDVLNYQFQSVPIRPSPNIIRTDYFEKFTLLDENAPGDPSKPKEDREHEVAPEATEVIQSSTKAPSDMKSTIKNQDSTLYAGEIASEHLDDVFYGNTEDRGCSEQEEGHEGNGDTKSPLKKSGSALFGSQETILTPIFLPTGPPKIIDPCLLEEPKAMAFLYTDLYEEAMGSRKKEEDTESMTSEKSFHSKESDTDDSKGYLEKFVLKDETPVTHPRDVAQDDGFGLWSQDKFDIANLKTQAEKKPWAEQVEEVTDFFRSSENSSPYENIEQTFVSQEESMEVKSRRVVFEDEVSKNKNKKPASQVPEPLHQPLDLTECNEICELDFLPCDDKDFPIEVGEVSGISKVDKQADSILSKQSYPEPPNKPPPPHQPPKSFLGLTPLIPSVTEEEEKAEEEGDNGKGKGEKAEKIKGECQEGRGEEETGMPAHVNEPSTTEPSLPEESYSNPAPLGCFEGEEGSSKALD